MVIKLKKYFIILLLFLMCGCYLSTPTKEVESYFNKYQTDYEKVISDIAGITIKQRANNIRLNKKDRKLYIYPR